MFLPPGKSFLWEIKLRHLLKKYILPLAGVTVAERVGGVYDWLCGRGGEEESLDVGGIDYKFMILKREFATTFTIGWIRRQNVMQNCEKQSSS
jgi:hypothetical protein